MIPVEPLPQAIEEDLAALAAQARDVRAAVAASPLGRYRAGQEAARAILGRDDAAEIVADVRDAVALSDILAAIVRDDEPTARDLLAELADRDPDLVTALQGQAERLADLAAQVGSGIR